MWLCGCQIERGECRFEVPALGVDETWPVSADSPEGQTVQIAETDGHS